MKRDEINTKLNLWSFPRGPFADISDIYTEMEATSRCLGANAAPELAMMLVQLDSEMDDQLEALYQFLQFYAKSYPKALLEALLQELRPTGPPTLVEILGITGSTSAVARLREVLAIDEADDDLLLSLACALGELGGAEALQMLHQLQLRPNLSKPVQHEINIALSNVGATGQVGWIDSMLLEDQPDPFSAKVNFGDEPFAEIGKDLAFAITATESVSHEAIREVLTEHTAPIGSDA